MSRQPEHRDFLDGDYYGPQADRGFGVAGQHIGSALDCLYMPVSFSETRRSKMCEEDRRSFLHRAKRNNR